jgi:hypothetical protein
MDMFPSELKVFRHQFLQAGSDECAKAAILRAAEIGFRRRFPFGTSIVIDLATFEFVLASTRTAALKDFVATFGKSASGWAFDVGRPMAVGGGACPS